MRSFVRKKVKAADLFTGEIVSFLGENLGVSTIVRRQFVPYKALISDFVAEQGLWEKSFLDFHGMVNNRPFDLAVGTGVLDAAAYKRELEFIRFLAEKYQIRIIFNHPDYRGGAGLCGRLQRDFNSNRVLQLEWRRDFRDFYACADIVCGQTLPFMAELINFLRRGFPGR